jgi:FMN phosphatase YigB (HAD superfamily)
MVDDREVNCDGARAVGMHAVLYQTNAQVQREITEVLAANA